MSDTPSLSAAARREPPAPRPSSCIAALACRRLHHRPGRRGDRPGGRASVPALLAGGGALDVARPGGLRAPRPLDPGVRPPPPASTRRRSMPPSASSPCASTISTSACARSATTAAQADRGSPDPAIAELRGRIRRWPAYEPAARRDTRMPRRTMAALRAEIASCKRHADLDRPSTASRQAKAEASALAAAGEQKALAAARASAVIGIAARLSAALDSGLPFATDLGLLAPLAKDDAKLGEFVAGLQPLAPDRRRRTHDARGRISRRRQGGPGRRSRRRFLRRAPARQAEGPGVAAPGRRRCRGRHGRGQARARRGGAERRRPRQGGRSREVAAAADREGHPAWLARAEAHLAAQRAVDQLAAHAVALLGAAR